MQLVRIFAVVLGAALLMGASKTPSAREGYNQTFVHDGKQNYPVTLYGVARDWELDCLKGKAAQCLKLGDALAEGLGDLNIEPRGAMGYWLLACDKGLGAGCSKAAEAIEAGTTNYPANPALAMQTAEKGCALQDTTSCATTALHYYRGDVVSQDRARAVTLWNAGCSARDETACRMKAGALLYDSADPSAQAEAVGLYQAACERKQGWGCSNYAHALASGIGVAADQEQAFVVGHRGCLEADGDIALACAIYGRFLAHSSDPDDIERASSLLTNACLAKVAEACDEAGHLGQKKPGQSKIAGWEVALSFREGCDLGYGLACGDLGMLYANGSDEIKVDLARAIALLDKGCALDDGYSCSVLSRSKDIAETYRPRRPAIDPAAPVAVQLARASEFAKSGRGGEALDTVARLMEESNPDAQWLLGGWLYYGYPGVIDQPDTQSGYILMDNAARQGQLEAMKWVAMALWNGDGVEVDQDKALGYMGYVAERGDPMAEAIWRSMKAEPIRQANARRAKEMAEEAERRKNDFWANFSSAAANWSASFSSYSSPSSASSYNWQSTASIMDQSNFNQFIDHMQGYTTACPGTNPYC